MLRRALIRIKHLHKERKVKEISTTKVRRKGLRKTFSPRKIVPHLKKKVTMMKKMTHGECYSWLGKRRMKLYKNNKKEMDKV